MIFSMANLVDLSIILIIGLSSLIGIMRGATRETLGIAGWVGAFATVFYGLPLVRPLGRQYIHNPMIADVVVAGLLFILSLAIFILISRTISSGVKGSALNGLDRSLGLVFGFVRGALVVCLAYLAAGFFYPAGHLPPAIQQAHLTPWIAQGAQELTHIIPKDYLPHNIAPKKISPLDPKDLLENALPTLEETVKHLSTLKPSSPKKTPSYEGLDNFIEKNDTTPQE
jgi:membrane protein required for colicin V production